MGMVAEEDQSFKSLIDHLYSAFQSSEMLSELISDFYGQSLKTRETEDTFTDDLQVLSRKIIAGNHLFVKRPIINLRPSMHTNCRISIMQQWHVVHCSPPQSKNHLPSSRDV